MSKPRFLKLPSIDRRWRLLLALVLCLEFLYLAEMSVRQREKALSVEQRTQVLETAAQARGRLETTLSSTIFLAHGLVALIKSTDELSEQQIKRALATLHNADPRVRNIGLAPGNVLRYVYPLAGNEKALGLNYVDVPLQWPGVQQAMDSGNTVIVGPVDLVQGGRAVISRTPVFLEDGDYWGVISIVIDLPGLLGAAEVTRQAGNVRIGVKGDSDSRGQAGWVLGGPQWLGADSIRLPINVSGGQWMLYAQPLQGWQAHPGKILRWRLVSYAGAIGLSLFIWLIMDGRARARRLAQRLQEANDRLGASNEALEYLSRYDPLTNVANRRYFDDMLAQVMARAARRQESVTVMMIDVDHFKGVNDTYGHQVGDQCLKQVAQMVMRALQRGEDFVARFGGEEFVVLASGVDEAGAQAMAERIRGAIAGTLIELETEPSRPLRITASIGVAQSKMQQPMSASELCSRADAALYQAKRDGRNRVRVYAAQSS